MIITSDLPIETIFIKITHLFCSIGTHNIVRLKYPFHERRMFLVVEQA